MTMYLPNRDIRPTGYEPAEFIEPSTFTPPPEPHDRKPVRTREPSGEAEGAMGSDGADGQLQFLEEIVEENASIAGDVIQVTEHLWAIHGFIPVDGDVLMAEFDSYEEATIVLAELPRRTRRRDDG